MNSHDMVNTELLRDYKFDVKKIDWEWWLENHPEFSNESITYQEDFRQKNQHKRMVLKRLRKKYNLSVNDPKWSEKLISEMNAEVRDNKIDLILS